MSAVEASRFSELDRPWTVVNNQAAHRYVRAFIERHPAFKDLEKK